MLFYDSFFCSLPLPNSTYILSIYGQQECSGLFGVYNPLKTCWSPIVAAFEYNWWFWRRRTILLSFYGRGSSLIQSGKKTTRKMSDTYDKIHNLRDTIKEWMNHKETIRCDQKPPPLTTTHQLCRNSYVPSQMSLLCY